MLDIIPDDLDEFKRFIASLKNNNDAEVNYSVLQMVLLKSDVSGK